MTHDYVIERHFDPAVLVVSASLSLTKNDTKLDQDFFKDFDSTTEFSEQTNETEKES